MGKARSKFARKTNLKIGHKYGMWTILEDTGKVTMWGERIYRAKTDSGDERLVWHSHLKYRGKGYPISKLNNLNEPRIGRGVNFGIIYEKKGVKQTKKKQRAKTA